MNEWINATTDWMEQATSNFEIIAMTFAVMLTWLLAITLYLATRKEASK